MKEVLDKLKEVESNLQVYDAFLKNPANSEADRKVVAFSLLYEMMAFTTLHEFVPEYVPSKSAQVILAQGLGGVRGFVSIVDGKVKVDPKYYASVAQMKELKRKQEELKNSNNGKLDKG